jgi:uncharacterized membrane protein
MNQTLTHVQPKTRAAAPAALASLGRGRLDSIDLVRGLIMVFMALDHVRDYFSNVTFDPMNLQQTTPGLFFTRWITHYCAPNFIFLAGAGALLTGARGRTPAQLAWFLVTRGLWLIFLELTVVKFFWTFSFDVSYFNAGVLWAIGWSMILLAPLVFLPTSAAAVFGIFMIAFHNLFDDHLPEHFGSMDWLWVILHHGGSLEPFNGVHFDPAYKIVPWAGVMAAGYAFGSIFLLERRQRRPQLIALGISLTAAFFVTRYLNLYGDPKLWESHDTTLHTIQSFLHCTKYPPSLAYLLMTIGPAILLLGLFDRPLGPLGHFFIVFGRVPLFFYLLHIPLIHGLAIAYAYWQNHDTPGRLWQGPIPGEGGVGLPQVYLAWIVVILLLWPPCYWFGNLKRRRHDAWLSYL